MREEEEARSRRQRESREERKALEKEKLNWRDARYQIETRGEKGGTKEGQGEWKTRRKHGREREQRSEVE